jgi:hypothetical protein
MNMVRKATDTQLTFLRNSGASFKVILADGETIVHDPNNLLEPKKKPEKKRRNLRNPDVKHGEPSNYVIPFLKALEPGQVVTIPNKYHPDTMRSVVCNHARRMWGEGGYMSEQAEDKNSVIVLRVK